MLLEHFHAESHDQQPSERDVEMPEEMLDAAFVSKHGLREAFARLMEHLLRNGMSLSRLHDVSEEAVGLITFDPAADHHELVVSGSVCVG